MKEKSTKIGNCVYNHKTQQKGAPMEELQATATRTVTKTDSLHYLLYLPEDYGRPPGVRYPLILLLHGAGERGDDLQQVKTHGVNEIVSFQQQHKFILAVPQCPKDEWWGDHVDALDQLLQDVISSYRIDTTRLYLTGLSMGGYGSWYYATIHPQRFAAVTPICGGGLPFYGYPERVQVLKDVPIWAFHGGADDVVPLAASQALVDALAEVNGNARLTIYPGVEHDSWTQTYANPDLYDWMFSHALSHKLATSQ
jgi:predicted peptidase